MDLLQGQFLSPSPPAAAWGTQEVMSLAAPAEGSGWSKTVLGGYAWQPVSVRFIFTAGAEAGERFAGLVFKDGSGHNLGEVLTDLPDEEGKASAITFMRSAPFFGGAKNNTQTIAMPSVMLEQGWTIEGTAVGLKPKDKLTAIVLWVEQFELNFDHLGDELRHDARSAAHALGEM